MTSAQKIIKKLLKLNNPKRAKYVAPYVGNKPGSYGEKDKLLGISAPVVRKISKDFLKLSFSELTKLISSEYHEIRFAAVVILVDQYKKAKEVKIKKSVFDYYVKHVDKGHINNWDIIDVSAYHICGPYLFENPDHGKSILIDFAMSTSVWFRRVAVVSTFHHIRENYFDITLLLSKQLLNEEHDLIHKACGWMLREIGKRDLNVLKSFLDLHSKKMPRVMLRYSIEKLTKIERKQYLQK